MSKVCGKNGIEDQYQCHHESGHTGDHESWAEGGVLVHWKIPSRTDALSPQSVRAFGDLCGDPDPEDGAGCTYDAGHFGGHWWEIEKPKIRAAVKEHKESGTCLPPKPCLICRPEERKRGVRR